MLFCVWEDARVCIWSHSNRSFDMHLSSLGSVFCIFSSQGTLSGVATGLTAGLWGHSASILNSLRAHCRGDYDVMARWLQHPVFTDMAGSIFHPQLITIADVPLWEMTLTNVCSWCLQRPALFPQGVSNSVMKFIPQGFSRDQAEAGLQLRAHSLVHLFPCPVSLTPLLLKMLPH